MTENNIRRMISAFVLAAAISASSLTAALPDTQNALAADTTASVSKDEGSNYDGDD